MASLVLSGYLTSFAVGSIYCGRTIERFDHVPAYAAFAGIVIAATTP